MNGTETIQGVAKENSMFYSSVILNGTETQIASDAIERVFYSSVILLKPFKVGNTLNVVTYFNDSSSGRTNPAYNMSRLDDTSETGQLQSTNPNDSIANNRRPRIYIKLSTLKLSKLT